MTVTPFQIHVSDDVLADLRARLTRTLFTSPSDSAGPGRRGPIPATCATWSPTGADGFDWRAAEAALNAVPQSPQRLAVGGQRTPLTCAAARPRPARAAAAGAVARLAGQLHRDAAGGPAADRPG